MKDDLSTADRRPPHRLRIPPALVADRHAEPHAVGFKDSPRVSRHVMRVLARVELVLGLVALNSPNRVNDIRSDLPAGIGKPLGSEHSGHGVLSRKFPDGFKHLSVLRWAKGEYLYPDSS